MIAAARETLTLANDGYFRPAGGCVEGTDFVHLRQMLETMEAGGMSEGKLERWLGWIQCAVVVNTIGRVSLEDCKQINRRNV